MVRSWYTDGRSRTRTRTAHARRYPSRTAAGHNGYDQTTVILHGTHCSVIRTALVTRNTTRYILIKGKGITRRELYLIFYRTGCYRVQHKCL